MKHLGDIKKISGYDIEPVWCITGGSPCQDLSVAGKRAGLAGERSGLFMEQIRIIKEMIENEQRNGRANELIRPRYLVWENVPGAFSSNKGQDFQAVLTEIVRIVEPDAPDVPAPEKGWPHSGCLYDELGKWSVAWRLHNAQYWGVPQRRRRIAVVADFGGLSAPEILFEPKGLRGDIAESGAAREGTSRTAERGANKADAGEIICMATQQGGAEIRTDDRAPTLTAATGMSGNNQPVVCSVYPINDKAARYQGGGVSRKNDGSGNGLGVGKNGDPSPTLTSADRHIVAECPNSPVYSAGFKLGNSVKARSIGFEEERAPTLNAECGGNKPAVLAVYDARGNGEGEIVCTLTGDHQSRVTDYTALVLDCRNDTVKNKTGTLQAATSKSLNANNTVITMATGQAGAEIEVDKCPTLNCNHEQPIAAYTLRAQGQDPHAYDLATYPISEGIVRRLTPLECERFQGFPDGWTDIGDWVDSKGKKHKAADTPRYKALGNSIALPFWCWLLERISAYLPEGATLGSLFDGIGGFPLIWESLNGKGCCLWASEIDEFCIAVTKRRFGED